jgi:hypothetical protein
MPGGMNMQPLFRMAVVGPALLASACAVTRDYVYRPSAPALADVDGYPAAVYQVPPERPEAEVRVVSYGISYLQTAPGPTSLPVLQVRLVLANNGDTVGLTFDTTQALVEIAGEGSAAPMYANSDDGGLPTIGVAQRQHKVVDLYFPLPATAASADRLPAFDLHWQVQTGTRLVSERTPFRRLELEPRPRPAPEVFVVAGWGPIWWYRPHYPHGRVFVHAPAMVVPPRHHRVVIVRSRPAPPAPRPPGR